MFRTIHYTVTSARLPRAFDGYRIAHLSDLHGAPYGRSHDLLLRAVSGLRPHLVAMTGDMVGQRDRMFEEFRHLCASLACIAPVFFIQGNHEQLLKPMQRRLLDQALSACRVQTLHNSYASIGRRSASIRLYGLVTPMVYYNDPLGEYKKGTYFSANDMARTLGCCDPDHFNLLLAHNPLYFPSYRDWGADLTLSGHIHGGIIRIPGIGGLLSPEVKLFPRYDGGRFREQGKELVVSRGLGNNFLFRVFNPPELVSVTLRVSAQRGRPRPTPFSARP